MYLKARHLPPRPARLCHFLNARYKSGCTLTRIFFLQRVVAILPYTKMPDTDELTFKKGDIFFVHNDMGNGWLWVTAHRTGEQGMIFRELVEDLDDSIDPNTVFPWFHPNCTKNEAVDLLVKGKQFEMFILSGVHFGRVFFLLFRLF
jgi:hypothetical protein